MIERACQSVGIDLGTTYSSLAYVDAQGIPRVVADGSGQAVMPSVVLFGDEEVIVGDIALQQARLFPDRVVQFIKVHMGDPWRKAFQGRVHTPESISALILGQLVKEASPQIGPIPAAVITVPAYFTEKRRVATQQAGEIAGLKVLGTLNEPMAATLAYGLHHTDREQIVAVYDLGGGTFDVTVVRISPNELEELATNGNRQLGGRDWDQALIDYVADDFRQSHGIDVRQNPKALQDLMLECERAKRHLGRMLKTSIHVQAEGRERTVQITRQTFEELTVHLLLATRLTTELAVADAGLSWSQISRVVAIGGSTQMPAVRRMLQDLSGKPPDTGVNPVLAVSLGAATYAHMLETGRAIQAVRRKPRTAATTNEQTAFDLHEPAPSASSGSEIPRVRFVTAHGVGIKIRQDSGWSNRVLVPKNTPVPARVTQRFLTKSTGAGGTQIRIEITQGDTSDLAAAEPLGLGRIRGLPGGEPEGQPVDVTMAFDEQGRLHVSALYVPRKQKMEMSVEIPGGLHPEDIQQHRQFLESQGLASNASSLLPEIPRPCDAEPVYSVEELMRALDIDLNDDDDDDDDGYLPMIEPLD